MKIQRINTNEFLQILSVITLLIVSCFFGLIGKTSEMGLAILAGALGLAFANIDKISEFSGAGFSAKMKDQVQAIIDKETEPDLPQDTIETPIDPDEDAVIKALSDPRYTWRTLEGVSKQTKLSGKRAWEVLVKLAENDYVRLGNNNKTGQSIWTLTHEGRSLRVNSDSDV